MKSSIVRLTLGIVCLSLISTCTNANVYYVSAANPAPAPPFGTWETAATNIQDAINLASSGDTVLVTNGIYAYGGLAIPGTITNRIALTNAITVQSVNGPWLTTILGAGATNGPSAVRCAWLTNGASLIGFTVMSGATQTSGDTSGGGIWCASSNALVSNCVIFSNTAANAGGGIYQGTVAGSLICSNGLPSITGGASYRCILQNCAIVGNACYGVASPMAMTNCIIYFNYQANYSAFGNSYSHCCTTPALAGTANFTNAPQLMPDAAHLATNSPCIGAGIAIGLATDIFGSSWSNPPSIGCAEWLPAPVIVAQPTVQFPFTGGVAIGASVAGQPPFTCWWTQNGQPVQDNGHFSAANTTALLINNVNLSDAAAYQVVVSNSFGMATSMVTQISIHCVAGSGSATAPYSGWTTAATNIQDAVNVSQAGDIVLVTNGLYAYGGLAMVNNLTNRVTIPYPVMVQSVNGPWVTIIQGGNVTNGAPNSRCAWLTNGAALSGFTLEGGRTQTSGSSTTQESGGGAWCASSNAIIENCLLYSNVASFEGGGAYLGTLRNCAVFGNNASMYGGGTYFSYLNNCTVTTNYAGFSTGGSYQGYFTNCIIYNNTNGNVFNSAAGQASYCCTYPLPSGGIGNFTNAPLVFVENVHLQTNSPCIGAGISLGSATDIDGHPWANPPSIGCSEAPTLPIVSQPSMQLTGNPAGFTIGALFTGPGPFTYWWLKDGVLITNNSQFNSAETTTLSVAGTSASDAGGYQLVVSNAFGVVTGATVQVTIHCVNVNGTTPIAPYTSWATAATNIQDAISAAAVGEIVLVTNGLYATGGISMDGVTTNRVSVNKAILVQSACGPNVTTIRGAWDPVSTNGIGAFRCVWMTNNAILAGFTLLGGATSLTGTIDEISGGAVRGSLANANANVTASVANCILTGNAAAYYGGAAYQVILNNCLFATNITQGSSPYLAGGSACKCNLQNCAITASKSYNGGGVAYCNLRNCSLTANSAAISGGGAYSSFLTNCTVTGNQVITGLSPNGGGVANSTLVNSVVYSNNAILSLPTGLNNYSQSNYYNSTFNYSCTAPLATGTGNFASAPLLLPDGVHLSVTSPCIGAGLSDAVLGSDIDGQPWNNPPSMGCDEFQPMPLVVVQPNFQIGSPAHGLTCNVSIAGQPPFSYTWIKDAVPVGDNGHYGNSGTAGLTVNNFGPDDAGFYQVIASNSFGAVTSSVVQLVIHVANAAGLNPVAPYSSWDTAATNIQDAINIATAGDVVLVTNGIYAFGGLAMSGNLTNRVALNKRITVVSANGYQNTAIQGAWDPTTTNGPGAVRCAYIADGAVLNGFSLQNGATRSTGDAVAYGPLESGGAIWCNSTYGTALNCVLSNNSAIFGGGMINGTLNNSLVLNNQGAGILGGLVNNCTIVNNAGGGVYSGSTAKNCIILGNYHGPYFAMDNYPSTGVSISYSCTSPTPTGPGNINVDPVFLDLFHISSFSPCRGAGSPLYSSGADLDGEPWSNPPSMGCDEIVVSNLAGPLTVSLSAQSTNTFIGRPDAFWGLFSGRASYLSWSYSDGQVNTNGDGSTLHIWTNSGPYTVTFSAYNQDNPLGISTNILIYVQQLALPQLQSPMLATNGIQFQFTGQTNANYTIQFSTNLAPPVAWQTLQYIYNNNQPVIQILDPSATNSARFYRVLAQ